MQKSAGSIIFFWQGSSFPVVFQNNSSRPSAVTASTEIPHDSDPASKRITVCRCAFSFCEHHTYCSPTSSLDFPSPPSSPFHFAFIASSIMYKRSLSIYRRLVHTQLPPRLGWENLFPTFRFRFQLLASDIKTNMLLMVGPVQSLLLSNLLLRCHLSDRSSVGISSLL